MKYERLTDREIAEMLKNTVEKSWDSDSLEAQCYIRLAELEDKIESGELDYVADSKTEQTITDLLIEFDEMGFAPTIVCPDGEKYAIDWRERVRKEFTRLTDENDNLTVELEVAQRDVENLTRTLDEANDEITALEAENAELQATLSKMETVEARLQNAVELPVPLGTPVLKVWRNRVPTDDTRMDFVDMWEITTVSFKLEYYTLWRKQYFHNTEEGRKAAEARLAELKGDRE